MQPEDKVLDSVQGSQIRRFGNRHFEYSLYLKKTFRDILPRALSEVCQVRPADPIEYLATLLYKAADSDMYFQEKAVFSKGMHAVASQMKQEDEKRQHAISMYKRQIYEFKRFVDTRHSDRLLPSALSLAARELSAVFLRKRSTSFSIPESTTETASELEPSRPDLKDDLVALKPRRATFVDIDHLSSHSSSSARVSPVTPDSSSRRSVVSVTSERLEHLIGTQKTYRASQSAKPRLLPKSPLGSHDKTGYSSGEELGTKKTKQAKKRSDQRLVADSQSLHTPSPIPASRPTSTTQAKKKPPRDTESPIAEQPASDRPRHKTHREKVANDTNVPETVDIAKTDSSAKAKTKEGKGRDKKVKEVTILGRQNLMRAKKPIEFKPPPSLYWLPHAVTDPLRYTGAEEEQEEDKPSERETATGVSETATGVRRHSDEHWTEEGPGKAGATKISKAEASGRQVEDERDSEDASKEMKFSDLEDEDQSPGRRVSLADLDDELETKEGGTSSGQSEAAKVALTKKMKYKVKKATDEAVGLSSPASSTRDGRSITDEDLSSKDEFILDDDQSSVKSTTPEIKGKKTTKKPKKLARPPPRRQSRLLSDADEIQETTAGQENVFPTKAKKKGRKGQYGVDSSEDTSGQITPQSVSVRHTLSKDGASRRSTYGAVLSPRMRGSIASFSQERQKKRVKKSTDTSEAVSRSDKEADASPGKERDEDEEETKRKVRKRHRKKKITDESEPEPEMTDVDILVSSASAQNIPVGTSLSKLVSKKTARKQRPKAAKGKMLTQPSFTSVALERAEQMNEMDEFEGSLYEDEAESTETIFVLSETPEEELPFTPVECVWYLVGARTLVCQHPVLGEIQAKGTAPASSQDFTGWMEAADYVWQSFYDPETYTLQDPWADDRTNVRRRTRLTSKDVKKK